MNRSLRFLFAHDLNCLSDLDTWGHRRSLEQAVRHTLLPVVRGTVLDLGCGDMPYRTLIAGVSSVRRYVGLDLYDSNYSPPDVFWDGTRLPFARGSADVVLLTEVLEHALAPHVLLSEVARVLAPGGHLFLTVPFIWNLHCVPHDYHRFTPYLLRELLTSVGLEPERMSALGGWDAALSQMLGLWLRRRPMRTWLRRLLSVGALPLVVALRALDQPPAEFRERTMLTGLSVLARRPYAGVEGERT